MQTETTLYKGKRVKWYIVTDVTGAVHYTRCPKEAAKIEGK
jgi:hypothetical protein